jgi:uncharacterized membrane protein
MTNPIKANFKTEILPIIIILISGFFSLYFYQNFPEQVPIHWNMAGEVDNYGSKAMGAFLFPAIILGMYLVFLVLPFMDPKKERYMEFRRVYHLFKLMMIFFMAIIYFLSSFSALGFDFSIGLWVSIMVGILFVFIGSYLRKIKSNWFIGIRLPWTLSSEENWNKTHRFSGWVYIFAGFLMMMMGLVPLRFRTLLFIIVLILLVGLPIGYSFWYFRKKDKK